MLIIWYARSHKVTTLSTFMSGVANYYADHDLGQLQRGRRYQQTMKGVSNFFGLAESTQPKAAIEWSQLVRLVDHLDSAPTSASFESARDRCLYLFSFYALLRLREIVGTRFTWQHVIEHEWGLELIVPYSKTNLRPAPVRIVARPDAYCPLRAYHAYRQHTDRRLLAPALPVFRAHIDRSTPLDTAAALSAFKQRLASVLQVDPSLYGWHSWRRGGTTALFLAGVPDSLIAAHGRWLSLTYRRYFDSSVHCTLPTARLLQATSSDAASTAAGTAAAALAHAAATVDDSSSSTQHAPQQPRSSRRH